LNKRTKILLRINEQAELFYDKSQELGVLAAQSFREEHGKERQQRHRAQMTGLENIAETTLKATDVLDYIKKQIARQEGWRNKGFGENLKSYIEHNLKADVASICASVGIDNKTEEDRRERQQIYLLLIRQFIRQIVVQYEYHVIQPERASS
jgi:hypothetical protein